MKLRFFIPIMSSMIVACTPTGLRSPGPSNEFAWTNRAGAIPAQVLPELTQCGGGYQKLDVKRGESTDNARARIQECMFSKGFYNKSGYGGYCSDPDYRIKLPVCLNTPLRPRNDYYGQ